MSMDIHRPEPGDELKGCLVHVSNWPKCPTPAQHLTECQANSLASTNTTTTDQAVPLGGAEFDPVTGSIQRVPKQSAKGPTPPELSRSVGSAIKLVEGHFEQR